MTQKTKDSVIDYILKDVNVATLNESFETVIRYSFDNSITTIWGRYSKLPNKYKEKIELIEISKLIKFYLRSVKIETGSDWRGIYIFLDWSDL